MASRREIVRQLVEENSRDEFLNASKILITFADNILQHQNEPKFRKVRIANPTIQNKLLNVVGGMECLFEMGFQEAEDGEHLILPADCSVENLRQVKNELTRERQRLQANTLSSNIRQTAPPNPVQVTRGAAVLQESEAKFLQRLEQSMQRVLNYESPRVQEKARSIIPVRELTAEAEAKKKSSASSKLDQRDFLLLSLLRWFKTAFFSWVDTLPCDKCGARTKHNGSLAPSFEDLTWGADRVEAHKCEICSVVTRFPRYTKCEKLLETRRGRCGEWADCFTLCCRALDFEARYVLDWTDHVWTEVFSQSQSRWLHCDPCENICDKPLLYESGWGKKLTYVIAFAKDDIQDVSWRYSAKHDELLKRRQLCREAWLRKNIHRLWRLKLNSQPSDRQRHLWQRLICELVEFVSTKSENNVMLPGRTTGSLEWRQARGELGLAAAASSVSPSSNFVFTPSEKERESEIIHILYSCSTDTYIRKSSGQEELKPWTSCVFNAKDIFRKEELDWKMVYLARMEGSSKAEVSWKFDLSDSDLRISKLELKAKSAVFENGVITWRLCTDDECFNQDGSGLHEFMTFVLKGAKTLILTAILSGGKGDLAWQHTQLFRQSLNDKDIYPFEIKLCLN